MSFLSIAGSDPSGGAGIQADLKTFAALGVDGAAVVTALTAQNARVVRGVMPVPGHFVALQLAAVFEDLDVAAVKIGMLGTLGALRAAIDAVRAHEPPFVVVDPVLRATAGPALLEPAAVDALKRDLFPLATVVTPNATEAGALLGAPPPRTIEQMGEAARRLQRLGPAAVLVTGGHVDTGDECVDILFDGTGIRELRVPRHAGANLHGSGCRLSSAITALLARGHSLLDACAEAQRFVAGVFAAHAAAVHAEVV